MVVVAGPTVVAAEAAAVLVVAVVAPLGPTLEVRALPR
jgi:hypothetical protein